jgi:hypothetical protein
MDKRDRKRDDEESQNDLDSPLGIAGTPVTPDAPDHLRASDDPDEARRRRDRALSAENDRPRPGMGDVNRDHKGATGIDMGAGGHNTQVSDRGTKPS